VGRSASAHARRGGKDQSAPRRSTFSACAGQTWTSDAGRLTVGSTPSRAGDTIIETDPKTERSRRTVSLDARTVAGLRTLRRTQPEETLALSTGWTEDALVAVDELGEPIYPRRWSRTFTVLARPAGLPLIRLHDLRHTTVTGALGAGVPVEVVSRRSATPTCSSRSRPTATFWRATTPPRPRSWVRSFAAGRRGTRRRIPFAYRSGAKAQLDVEATPGIEPGYRALQSAGSCAFALGRGCGSRPRERFGSCSGAGDGLADDVPVDDAIETATLTLAR
jgi:hypothetical protein